MSVRAVFLVHGVGEHKRGQFLEAVLEPLMRFLRTSFADPHVTVHQRPANGPAHATIEFLNERWEVWEVWWTQAFHAQTGQRVLLWAYRALALKALRFLAGTLPFYRTRRTPPTTHPVYQGPPITYGGVVYDIVVGLSLTMILVLAYIPLLLLASVLYVLSLLPAWLFFPRLLRVAVVKLASYVVQGPGDQYALMFTETAAAAAQQPFRDVLGLYFDPSRTDRRHCDSATVIAHSAGATLAFATLSDPVLWRTWTGTSEPPVDMTLFTVGSSLTVSDDNVPNHPMWQTSLPQRITWVDLWARYDPVPQGPPRRQLAQRVRGPAGHFFTVRVVNMDSPFSDHTEYWANHE